VSGRTFLLLGSGEFEPWSAEPERAALDGRAGSVAIVPTASAPEGDKVFDRWANMGLEHYASIGLEAHVVPMKVRADADRDDVVAMLEDAAIVYFSGGNPRFLADTLRGTAFWRRMLERLDEEMVYAGCSAGAMVASRDPNRRPRLGSSWVSGLGLVEGGTFGVHWDRIGKIPGFRGFVMSRSDGVWFVGIDERTAILGDGQQWRVFGQGRVSLRAEGRSTTFGPGETFTVPGAR
jgi:cyanophycinase